MTEARPQPARGAPAPLHATRAAALAAERRLFARALVSTSRRWLAIGAGAGGAIVLADALLGPADPVIPWWALLGAPTLIGAGGAIAVTLARRPSVLEAAGALDAALGLHDRLSTALGLATPTPGARDDAAFVALASREAERAAPRADARKALPVSIDGAWWAWAAIVCAGALAGAFLPRFDLLRPGAAAAATHARLAEAERERAADAAEAALAEAQREIREAGGAVATPEQSAAIDEIGAQLTRSAPDPGAGRAAAAAGIDDAASRLEEESDASRRSLDALGERLARAGKSDGASADSAEQEAAKAFEDALRRGDFAGAAKSLDDVDRALRGEGEPLTDTEREALRARLSKLADDIAPRDADPQPANAGASDVAPTPEEQSLRDQGLSEEDARRLAGQTDPAAAREALERQGMSADDAQRLADRAAEAARERAAREEAERKAKELRDALKDAARPTPKPDAPPKEKPSGSREGPKQSGDQTPRPEGAPDQKQPSPSGESKPESSPDGDASPEQGEKPGEQGVPDPKGDTPGADAKPEAKPGERAPDAPGQPPAPAQSPAKGDDPNGAGGQPGQSPTDSPPGKPPQGAPAKDGKAPGSAPGKSPPGADAPAQGAPGAQPGQNGAQRAKEALERLAKERQGSERMRSAAERLRRQSRDLAEGAGSREQRQRWQEAMEKEGGGSGRDQGDPLANGDGAGNSGVKRGPREGGAESGPDSPTESVDVRRAGREEGAGEEAERVAAEWFNPDGTPKRAGPTSAAAPSGERVREAAKAAERAIEEQAVPRRRAGVVRRFFQKLPESPRPAQPETPAQPAPPGETTTPAPAKAP